MPTTTRTIHHHDAPVGRRRRRWARLLATLAAAALLIAACGDGEDDAADETTTTAAPAAPDTDTDTGGEAAGDAITVDLGEFFITMPTSLTAGSLTFDSTNSGEFPHALAVARGSSYDDLPQKENGAVDLDALGDDFLGTTENYEAGAGGSITWDLEPGEYVFFCPIEFGPNSHAGNGQVLSVSIG